MAKARLGIIAGTGRLPQILAEYAATQGRACSVITLAGVPVPWADGRDDVIRASFEKLGTLWADMTAAGIRDVVFAGAMTRPKLDMAAADAGFLALAPKLLPALQSGDDAALAVIVAGFEAQGFDICGADALLPDLTEPAGVLGRHTPKDADRADAARAAEIVAGLGALDIGQGAVVAQGLCMATESIQGTDAMLGFAADGLSRYRPAPEGARGVLLKAPKPGQDRRIDLPAIGPDTIRNAAAAGLGGVVIAAGGVMILDRQETIAEADRTGLFLWSRAPEESNP